MLHKVHRIAVTSIIDDVKDDVVVVGNAKCTTIHNDIGLALALENNQRTLSHNVAELLSASLQDNVQRMESNFDNKEFTPTSDLTKLIDYANTRWIQFPSDKKQFIESQMKYLDELKEKEKVDKERRVEREKYQSLLKKYGLSE